MLHARQRAQTALQLVEEGDALLVLGVLLSTETHLRGQQSVDTPPGIGVDEAMQTAEKQSRRSQQNHRKRDFADHEHVSQAMLRTSGGTAARVLAQREVEIGARREPRGNCPEEHACQDRAQQRETKYFEVELY